MNYKEIKQSVLAAYFDGLRVSLKQNLDNENALGYMYYQFEEKVFNEPIEELMFETIALILSGKNYPIQNNSSKLRILNLMNKHGLKSLLSPLANEESEEFLVDLNLVVPQ